MATETSYIFSTQNNFPSQAVASDRLMQEIRSSSISVAIDYISTSGDAVTVWFKDILSSEDQATLQELVAAHSGKPLPSQVQPVQLYANATTPMLTDPNNRQRVVIEKPITTRSNFYSIDWTDPTTWYPNSIYVASETATNPSGDLKTFQLANINVIDSYHGNITLEDQLKDTTGHSYRAVVSPAAGGAAYVEQDPHYAEAGGGPNWDYTINYAAGTITFQSSIDTSPIVAYHYANVGNQGSMFKVVPPAGQKLTLSLTEVQFSTDIIMTDTVMLQVFGTADYFLTSAQMQGMGITPGIGYKVPLLTFPYKQINDMQNDAIGSLPVYPAIGDGGTGVFNWRSQKKPIVLFQWQYLASTSIQSSKGMEIRVYLQHDIPMIGWMATGTFYCLQEVDT